MKRTLIAAAALLSLSLLATAQKGQKYGTTSSKKAFKLYEEAKEANMSSQDRQRAAIATLDKLEAALQEDPNYMEALFAAADMYGDLGHYGSQINVIKRAVKIDSTYHIHAYFACAEALCKKGNYREALHWFQLYDRFSAGRNMKKKKSPLKETARVSVYFQDRPVPYDAKAPGEAFKLPYELYWPSITLDERALVVTSMFPRDTAAFKKNPVLSRNSDRFQEDFFISNRKDVDEEWGTLTSVRSLNTPFNEGTLALSPDGTWAFYTACGLADSKGSCDIYFTRRTENGWTKGVNVGMPVNSRDWESQPCLSADGTTLFFISTRSGGKGKGDIWYAKLKGMNTKGIPQFGLPVNLGDSINSPGDEGSPFLHPDGKSLYFASNGWPGVGGMDVFVSRRKDNGTWTTPKNFGYPVNSTEDDEGLVVTANGLTGYYNTNRKDNKREVLMFQLNEGVRPEPVSYVRGVVTDCRNKLKVIKDATVRLVRKADNVTVVTSRTMPDGSFVSSLPAGADYVLTIEAPGYFFTTQEFSLADVAKLHGPVNLEVCLPPLVPGEKIALHNIYFDTDKADLRPESVRELDLLVKILVDNPKIRLEIGGHTDNRASAQHNMSLSQRRAASTVEYLTSHGIKPDRLVPKGYGLTQPCATNDTEEGRQLNRRMEAKIIGN